MFRSLLFSALTTLFVSCFSYGQGIDAIPAIEFGSHKAKDILNDAEQRANNVLTNAEMAANRVASDAAVRITVLAQNLRDLLGRDLDKRFDQLDAGERTALAEINLIIEEANQIMVQTTALSDDLDINFNRTLNRVPLLKKAPLSVSRIRGMYQVHRGFPYMVALVGNGFGLQGLSTRTSVAAFVNGERIDDQYIIPEDQNQTRLMIPQKLIDKHFDQRTIRRVALWVRLTDRSWIGSDKHYTFDLPLILYPLASASINTFATVLVKTWDELPRLERVYEFMHGGNGTNWHVQFRKDVNFEDTLFAEKARIDPGPMVDACRWCAAPDITGLLQNQDKTYELLNSNNPRAVVFKAACNSNPCNLRWIVTYKQLSDRREVRPLQIGKLVGFGDQFDIELPADARDWLIQGRFFTGQPIDCKKGNCSGYVKFVSETDIGSGLKRVTLKMWTPKA